MYHVQSFDTGIHGGSKHGVLRLAPHLHTLHPVRDTQQTVGHVDRFAAVLVSGLGHPPLRGFTHHFIVNKGVPGLDLQTESCCRGDAKVSGTVDGLYTHVTNRVRDLMLQTYIWWGSCNIESFSLNELVLECAYNSVILLVK